MKSDRPAAWVGRKRGRVDSRSDIVAPTDQRIGPSLQLNSEVMDAVLNVPVVPGFVVNPKVARLNGLGEVHPW